MSTNPTTDAGNIAGTPRLHELKTDPDVFDDVDAGRKTFEIRKNDRDFQVGDSLLLRRTKFTGAQMAHSECPLIYTGEEITTAVKHILRGPLYGLSEGWVILSITGKETDFEKLVTSLATARAELQEANHLLSKLEPHAVDLEQQLKNAEKERDYLRSLSANWKACADEYEKQRDESAGKLQEAQRERDNQKKWATAYEKSLNEVLESERRFITLAHKLVPMLDGCHSAYDRFQILGSRLAAETAKNAELQNGKSLAIANLGHADEKIAELQAYVRKLARLLGCKDGEDSPELGIKELLTDRAELREKLAKAEKERDQALAKKRPFSPEFADKTINEQVKDIDRLHAIIAAIRGNDKAEKGAGE